MWPWGHLAFGYFWYSAWIRLGHDRRSGSLAVVVLAIGTQFPDLIDKPLAYTFAILPEGRSLAHSFFFLIPVCAIVMRVSRNIGGVETGTAFTTGYVSHLIADGLPSLLDGNMAALTFFVWPVLPAPDYEAQSFSHHWIDLAASLRRLSFDGTLLALEDWFTIQFWLVLGAILVWVYDGAPPLPAVWRAIKSPQ